MSKCRMKLARSDMHYHVFVCIVGHDKHSIYAWAPVAFKGVVYVQRKMWNTRVRWGKEGVRR
jgi:hypothetical protein